MKVVSVKTQARSPGGTSEARRARSGGRLPAVVYGDGKEPEHFSVDRRDFSLAVERGARVIDLEGESGVGERVLLKDLQYDALGMNLIHADFVRVNPKKEIELRIPLDLRGVPLGVTNGGILNVAANTLTVRCLPGALPEELPVDISGLTLGSSLNAADVPMPEGVVCADDPMTILVVVMIPRGVSADEEAAAEGEGEGEGEAAAEGGEADG